MRLSARLQWNEMPNIKCKLCLLSKGLYATILEFIRPIRIKKETLHNISSSKNITWCWFCPHIFKWPWGTYCINFFLVMWSLRILLFLWHMWVPPDKQKSCKVQTQTTETFIAVLFLVLTLIDMSKVI